MSAPELAIGHIVAGKYSIQSLLHHGGVTATYHAVTAPNRDVALKLYDPRIKSFPDVMREMARYETIVKTLPAHLVMHVVERGEDPSTKAPYTVTDLSLNPSLAELVDLCPLSPTEMATLVRNLGKVLDLAHASGISHLSLKPTNLFVGPAPACDLRVADFGMNLVRRAVSELENDGGIVPWLAPEQMKPKAAVTTAADVFTTGLVAFFAVTGKSYWRSCQPHATDPSAWRWEVLADRTAASARARELSVSLSSSFDAAFARALAVAPTGRFKTGAQFAEALASAIRTTESAPTIDAAVPMHATSIAASADVPPPPPQLEATLAAFEAKSRGGATATPAASDSTSPATDVHLQAQAEALDDLIEGPARRSRAVWFAVVGVAAIAIGGAVLAFSGKKHLATHTSAAVPIASPVVPIALPAISPAGAASEHPEGWAFAPTIPPPETSASAETPVLSTSASAPLPVASQPPAPVRAPRIAPRVVPPPPRKKPCGKFLKRCP